MFYKPYSESPVPLLAQNMGAGAGAGMLPPVSVTGTFSKVPVTGTYKNWPPVPVTGTFSKVPVPVPVTGTFKN